MRKTENTIRYKYQTTAAVCSYSSVTRHRLKLTNLFPNLIFPIKNITVGVNKQPCYICEKCTEAKLNAHMPNLSGHHICY